MAGDKLISMKLTKAEAKQENEVTDDRPEFPFGLSLRLDNEALGKLGMKTLPEVGSVLNLMAKVEVTEVSEHSRSEDKEPVKGLSLQITDMGLHSESKSKDAAEELFGEG